ncbi:MAG: aldo/keto reductase [Terrimicrobiaceae bacterium]
MNSSRRDFLKKAALAGVSIAVASARGETPAANPARLPRRKFGGHPDELSVVGFGGIVVKDTEQSHANRVVAEFYEKGINYYDVAPGYGDAEINLGPALAPYRKNCFLACKTGRRDRVGAEQEFRRSLERLQTDYFDLYQLHAITDVAKDVDAAFAPGGVMEFLVQAKKDGRVRYLGFSAHSVEAARAALERHPFDSVLFPVNFASYLADGFGPQILALAEEKGAARLALKALAKQTWPKDSPLREEYKKCWYEPLVDPREAGLALRFTLGKSVTAALPPGDERLFRLAVDLAFRLQPLTADDEKELALLAGQINPLFRA